MAQGAIASAQRGTVHGIAWMVLTGVMFVFVTGIVRYLGTDLPAVEAAFLRYLIGLILIAPALVQVIRTRLPGDILGLYAIRGLAHGVGVFLWFYAMARIPIAEVTAIGYTTPIFITIGAALFLGERLYMRRIAAVAAGFLGVVVILRPGFHEVGLGQLAQFLAAPFFAVSYLLAKVLTGRQNSAVIVAMLSLFCTLALMPGAIAQWRAPSTEELFWLTMTAVFATTGHYTLTRALQAAPITVTQPVGFLQLVWATLLGMAMFGEALDPFVFVGGGIIVGAATYISHREAVAARRAITPPAVATKT